MSSGSRVRREGTIAMSSKPYARRPFLPRPISISIARILAVGPDEKTPLEAGPNRRRRGAVRVVSRSVGQPGLSIATAPRVRTPLDILDLT